MIWTDCDREGEHIGTEIADIVKKVNIGIKVERARFSAIIPASVSLPSHFGLTDSAAVKSTKHVVDLSHSIFVKQQL